MKHCHFLKLAKYSELNLIHKDILISHLQIQNHNGMEEIAGNFALQLENLTEWKREKWRLILDWRATIKYANCEMNGCV